MGVLIEEKKKKRLRTALATLLLFLGGKRSKGFPPKGVKDSVWAFFLSC